MPRSPRHKTPSLLETQHEASRKVTINDSRWIAYELGNEAEMDKSISFIEALLGDG